MYDAKSWLILLINDEDTFMKVTSHVITREIFNIYLIKRSANPEIYLIYDVCAFCFQGKHQVRFINGWKQSGRLQGPFKFSSSFKGQFFGAHLKVGLTPSALFVKIPDKTRPGGFRLGGQDYWFLEALAKAMNFKIALRIPKDGISCYYDPRKQYLTGFCEMLYDREVDLAGFPTGFTSSLNYFLDPTGTYHMVQNRIISLTPEVEEATTFNVNATFLLAVLVLFVLISILSIIILRFYGMDTINDYVHIVFQTLSIVLLESVTYKNLRISAQIVIGVWLVGCFFIITNFFGDMISTAAVSNPKTKFINNLEDMKEGNISWIQSPLFQVDDLLIRKLPEQAKFKKYMGLVEGLFYMLKTGSKNYVYICPREAADAVIRRAIWNGKGTSPVYFSPPLLGDSPHLITVLQRKDSPYTKKMTEKILEIDAMGLLRGKYLQDAIDLFTQLSNLDKTFKEKPKKDETVTFEYIAPYLQVCGILLAVATVVFLVEIVSLFAFRFIKKILNGKNRIIQVKEIKGMAIL